MTKEKNKRNVGFSLYSEALSLASTTLGCAAPFWEVLGKGPAGASLPSPVGPLAPGAPRASGVAAGAVLSLCSLPHHSKARLEMIFCVLGWVGGSPVLFALSAVLELDSMINPASCGHSCVWRPLVGGVGQSPNCSALAQGPWATTAGDSSVVGV